MEQLGATPLAPPGSVDVGDGTTFESFGNWQADYFWPGLAKIKGFEEVAEISDSIDLSNTHEDAVSISTCNFNAKVKSMVQLTRSILRPKFHMKVEIPEDAMYEPGAYLEVHPRNSSSMTNRLVQVFKERGYSETDQRLALIASRHELHHPATVRVSFTSWRDLQSLIG